MAEITIQVSDLEQLTQAVGADFLHLKQLADNGDYKITVEDFSATLAEIIPLDLGDLAYLDTLPSIAGNGLTSTGIIPTNYLLSLGTPSTISRSTTNSVTTSSHTHAIDPSVTILRGGIILFHGTFIGVNPVPLGSVTADTSWVICNGANGTPDMRDRVPIGSGNLYPINSTGGSKDAVVVNHTHSAVAIENGAHTHLYDTTTANPGSTTNFSDSIFARSQSNTDSGVGTPRTRSSGEHTHSISVTASGESGVDKNLPPYRATAFIMKV
jgi:hypothetical protein